jgi:hypothetical protein
MHNTHSPSDAKHDERVIAVAVVGWLMLAGACVVVANAWAMGI